MTPEERAKEFLVDLATGAHPLAVRDRMYKDVEEFEQATRRYLERKGINPEGHHLVAEAEKWFELAQNRSAARQVYFKPLTLEQLHTPMVI